MPFGHLSRRKRAMAEMVRSWSSWGDARRALTDDLWITWGDVGASLKSQKPNNCILGYPSSCPILWATDACGKLVESWRLIFKSCHRAVTDTESLAPPVSGAERLSSHDALFG